MKKEGLLFENYLKSVYGIKVELDESGWEGVTLYHEELDPNLFPEDALKNIPDPLLILATSYDDSKGQEWVFYLATQNDDATKWLYAACLKEGELFDTIPLNGGEE